jgi:hypothetical protein
MRSILSSLMLLGCGWLAAQPDTLFITSGDSLYAFPVVYEPERDDEQYKRIGHFAHDPDRVAVELDYKRGKPSGVYRAFYPDGKPLIFAVYGWGSLHGDWTEYDEFGRVMVKGQYRHGLREGTWAFRRDGIVGRYKNGLEHGKWKYYENGRLVGVEKYRNGELLPGSTYRIGE